jgi:hypothetical protein
VEVLRSTPKPWLLITDWPVENAESTVRIFRMYRQRWAVEGSSKFTKGVLGWEEVPLLDLEGVCTLLALDWVAAGVMSWASRWSGKRYASWPAWADGQNARTIRQARLCSRAACASLWTCSTPRPSSIAAASSVGPCLLASQRG